MSARAHIFRYSSTIICILIHIYVCVWFQVSGKHSSAINHHIDKFRYIISFEW